MFALPGSSHRGPLLPLTEEERHLRGRLRQHVSALAGEIGERHVGRASALEQAALYIERVLTAGGYDVARQPYFVGDQEVRNLEAERLGVTSATEILVLGAHYDTVPGSPGANDNASGVAALLELARLFHDRRPARTIRFVAFVNEEPPFFTTDLMGSVVYARRCRARRENIVGMFSLETIGYYTNVPGTQQVPGPALFHRLYPSTGNFIGFVANLRSRQLMRRAGGHFRRATCFPSEGVAAPTAIPGIGWSDHWAFWQEGYQAVMLTDTAPFRYPHYHVPSDTPDKLDYDGLARVVAGLGRTFAAIANDTR